MISSLAMLFALMSGGSDVKPEPVRWFCPQPYTYVQRDEAGVPLPGQDADGMRDDWLAELTPVASWSGELAKTAVFKSFLNILPPNPLTGLGQTEPRLTDPEMTALTGELTRAGLKQAFETGGVRLAGDRVFENAGEGQSALEIPWLQRWVNFGGQVDFITTDHAVTKNWRYQYTETDYPYPMTMDALIAELADYFEAIRAVFPQVRLGIIEGPAVFQVTTAAGFVFPPNDRLIPVVDFAGFLDALLLEMSSRGLVLDHYHVDHGPHAVRADAGHTGVDGWEFGRVIAVEQICRSRGVRTGILIFPGRDFYGPVAGADDAEFSRQASATMIRYLEEYRQAGGQAEDLSASTWHYYPIRTGPEAESGSAMNIARELWRRDDELRGR